MNITTSESSLYQLTQDLEQPLLSIAIGADSLKSYVNSVVDLVVEKQLKATVWLKLPQTKSWVHQVQKLQRQGNIEGIYIANNQKHPIAFTGIEENNVKTPIYTFKLANYPLLQRESFIIVLAPKFCCLIIAQWQEGKIQINSSGKRLQHPYLEMVSSFDAQIVKFILSKVKQKTIAADNNLNDKFNKHHIIADPQLLNELLLKQVQHSEQLQKAWEFLARNNNYLEKTQTVFNFQTDFIGNLIQELRPPITYLKTALSLLESKQIKGEQRQKYLQMVSDQCDRQNSLINGLLELLQLDTPIQAESLNLNEIVPGIVSTYQPLAKEREIQLGYTIAANLPLISCPLPWFRQIIINLLNNSLQFTPAKGRVFVQATSKNDNEYVEITVSDTGIGIAATEINKIFDGFYRTKPIATEKLTGVGLGLTIVKQLIQRCGGSISVSSKVEKGTTFKILMPVTPVELAP